MGIVERPILVGLGTARLSDGAPDFVWSVSRVSAPRVESRSVQGGRGVPREDLAPRCAPDFETGGSGEGHVSGVGHGPGPPGRARAWVPPGGGFLLPLTLRLSAGEPSRGAGLLPSRVPFLRLGPRGTTPGLRGEGQGSGEEEGWRLLGNPNMRGRGRLARSHGGPGGRVGLLEVVEVDGGWV